MKQRMKRFMAGFLALLTVFTTLLGNVTTAFAASPSANIAFWYASTKASGEVSELKAGYNHGKVLYAILDGNAAYCMNFGLAADGGQLMNSYPNSSTSMTAQQEKLLSYCLYFGFNSNSATPPSNDQCDQFIATQAMVWVIVGNLFGTGSGDSAARKLCDTAPNPSSSYAYYTSLKNNISKSYNATRPSFASRTQSGAETYELKWNEGSKRFEKILTDSNGVLGSFDISLDGFKIEKNGNSVTISSKKVKTEAVMATMNSTVGAVETTSSCVFWLTEKANYQEFVSERPSADPVHAYFKAKTEDIGYGELVKTDKSSGVKLKEAVYGIYSDSGCTKKVDTMTTDSKGHAKSKALTAGTYYVKEITAPKGYVLSGKVHTLTVKAGQTKLSFLGEERVVGCLCKCTAEELEKERAKREAEENLMRIQQMKSAGLQDRTFYHYTFERCDASQENAVYAKRYVEHFKEMAQTGQGLLFWIQSDVWHWGMGYLQCRFYADLSFCTER